MPSITITLSRFGENLYRSIYPALGPAAGGPRPRPGGPPPGGPLPGALPPGGPLPREAPGGAPPFVSFSGRLGVVV